MEDENSKKKVKRRKDDYGYISFLLPKKTKDDFVDYLNNHKTGITKYFTDCVDVTLESGLMPRQIQQNGIGEPPAMDKMEKEMEEMKSTIDLLNAKVDMLIKLLSLK